MLNILILLEHINIIGPDGSMSWVVGLTNNLYKPITAWVRARLCKLQQWVHSTRNPK